MRLGVKAKDALAVTLLTLLVVATTTLVHVSQLSRVIIEEALQQADLVARQIYAQSRRSLARTEDGSPREHLRRDRELRSLLDASVGYSPHLLYAMIADREGNTILHSERQKQDLPVPERPRLARLLSRSSVGRFRALYNEGKIYEATLPIQINGEPFGNIKLGIHTSLLRRELSAALKQSVALAGLALPVAWLVAMGLASVMLKRVRTLVREVDRLRRGEFEVARNVGGGDELAELASQLQLLGQQVQSDRLKMLSEQTQLHQVVDQLEDGVILLNHDRQVLFFNKGSEVILGRPLEQAVGMRVEDVLEPSHPLCPLIERAFAQGSGVRNATLTVLADGKSRELIVSCILVGDTQEATGAMLLLKDLESVKTVQSLINYSTKLAALGQLTSGVAHEVKNPLNAMIIHLALLKERLASSPGDIQDSLEIIGSEIGRLDRVVQGFLKFIRPQELRLKPVDLNGLLQEVAILLEVEWQKEGVRFGFQLDPVIPRITGDEELLRQAFLNIILNACQAMPAGGMVSIATAQEQQDSVRVSIADEGVGIPTEDLDKIFRLYYTTKPGGSGIGLSMVYRVVQMHEGFIGVVSDVGRGATVTVRLPSREHQP
ncbi:MAG: PAS domain-containing sensor histidine kinase [Candidatus Methylomirabilia bacterium]